MTDDSTRTVQSAERDAVQAVVDRVTAWQHGATDGTVHDELRKGFGEVGVTVDDAVVEQLAERIEADEGPFEAAAYLD